MYVQSTWLVHGEAFSTENRGLWIILRVKYCVISSNATYNAHYKMHDAESYLIELFSFLPQPPNHNCSWNIQLATPPFFSPHLPDKPEHVYWGWKFSVFHLLFQTFHNILRRNIRVCNLSFVSLLLHHPLFFATLQQDKCFSSPPPSPCPPLFVVALSYVLEGYFSVLKGFSNYNELGVI